MFDGLGNETAWGEIAFRMVIQDRRTAAELVEPVAAALLRSEGTQRVSKVFQSWIGSSLKQQ